MPDQARRIAVFVFAAAACITLAVPLQASSQEPSLAPIAHLIEAVEPPAATVARGNLSARVQTPGEHDSTQQAAPSRQVTLESLLGPTPLPSPGSVSLSAQIHIRPTPTPRPQPPVVQPPASGTVVRGTATWYCCTAGYRGQAVVALPGALGGRYDPPPASRYVTVCGDRCVRLPVVDYCNCYWGTASQRVADLSPEAWAAVTDRPRSAGVVTVTVHL